jgi:signal-transduction protein with cAMP-binding, CBS, and nucleotidyltransferase domain
MMVREVMRPAAALGEDATLEELLEAMGRTGCEALPIVDSSNGDVVVRQLVGIHDLPRLRLMRDSAARGHAVGETVIELLGAMGRKPGRFPTITPQAALADAWGAMSDSHVTHLPVVENHEVVGMVSLVVTFSEFPTRSPTAGFWR